MGWSYDVRNFASAARVAEIVVKTGAFKSHPQVFRDNGSAGSLLFFSPPRASREHKTKEKELRLDRRRRN